MESTFNLAKFTNSGKNQRCGQRVTVKGHQGDGGILYSSGVFTHSIDVRPDSENGTLKVCAFTVHPFDLREGKRAINKHRRPVFRLHGGAKAIHVHSVESGGAKLWCSLGEAQPLHFQLLVFSTYSGFIRT